MALNILKMVTDKRGRDWEMYCDTSYFDLFCCRCTIDKNFNSQFSFRFDTYEEAMQFMNLIKEAR